MIICDTYEPAEMQEACDMVMPLHKGDYMITTEEKTLFIERKTRSDAWSSFTAHRLDRQAAEVDVLIVENNYIERGFLRAVRVFELKRLNRIAMSMPVLHTASREETVELLRYLEVKLIADDLHDFRPNKMKYNGFRPAEKVLMSFPDLGPKKVKAILSRFKTLEEALLHVDQWIELERLGPADVRKAKAVLQMKQQKIKKDEGGGIQPED